MVKCTPRVLFIFFEGDFLGSSTEKNTQQFQALNGLNCSTQVTRFLVGIRYNIIRVYPLFWSTKSKTINFFRTQKNSDLRIAPGGGNAAQTIKNFHFWPRGVDSLDRFRKFLRPFIRLPILHQCFKFRVICFPGYRVIAEKPRVGKLGQIIPCTLQEKLCVGSKNE